VTDIPIPWTETWSTISNIAIGVAAIIATIAGYIGFQQWRREMKGKAQFDLVVGLARLAMKYRSEFNYARNPVIFSSEYANRPAVENESHEEKLENDGFYARMSRFNPLAETTQQLELYGWESSVFCDTKIQQLVKPLITLYKEFWAYTITAHQMALQHHEELFPPEKWLGAEDDIRGKQIDDTVLKLMNALKVLIK
jgi:hypothetical protein